MNKRGSVYEGKNPQKDNKGKEKASVEEIRDQMKKKWVEKSELDEGSKAILEAPSSNSFDN